MVLTCSGLWAGEEAIERMVPIPVLGDVLDAECSHGRASGAPRLTKHMPVALVGCPPVATGRRHWS